MAYNLSPIGECQFVDANGSPYSGAKLFIYTAGSSTKATTYQDNAGGTPHADPIVLNTKGEVADGSGNRKPIWLPSGASYKFILAPSTDTDPPTSSYWTIDNIVGINDTTVTISEWITGPTPTYVSATSFTLVGDQTSTFNIGRRLKTTNSGGTIYSTIVASVYSTLTTITVINDSGTLDSGLSAVYYGITSAANTSLAQPSSWGLILSDDTASAGPTLTLDRISASPAASDVIGVIPLSGRNSSAAKKTYAQLQGEINDPTAASEDGQITLWTMIAGTLTKVGTLAQGLQLGSPTGGDKGSGTFNATAGYINNVSVVISASYGVQTTTSGTSIDFPSIPSWVKKITLQIYDVSTNGTDNILVQLGTGGTPATTGYAAGVSYLPNAGAIVGVNSTAGLIITGSLAAASIIHGRIMLDLVDPANNKWVCSGILQHSDAQQTHVSGGSKALTGTLDTVRVTTTGGTNTFDRGAMNIIYSS